MSWSSLAISSRLWLRTQYVDPCGRGTRFGGRGEMAMSPPRCARLFSPHGDFSQDVGARCSKCPTGACSSQHFAPFFFGVLMCFQAHETQRLAPGEGKVPHTASTHGTGARTSGIVGMLGPRCRLTSGHSLHGRPTPKLAGD